MINVGVSACVLGENVRYDGGHKKSHYTVNYLTKVFNLIPVCPEVGMGMTVPRPPIRIIEKDQQVRLVDVKDSSIDYTSRLSDFYQKKHAGFAALDGYIFAAKSPTCGVERIKVYDDCGNLLHRKGAGVFAHKVKQAYPFLPIEEDGRLNDKGLRESFVTRVYVHARYREEVLQNPTMGALVDFHSKHKFLVMAYSPMAYRQLGRIVANAKTLDFDTVSQQYQSVIMQALSKPTNRKKHTNVLMHLQGFLKKNLARQDKQELCEQIEQYRKGYVPLLAPITLMNHHLKAFPNEYIASQVYLRPFPPELELRA